MEKYGRLIIIAISNCLKKYGLTASVQDMEDIRQNILTYIWAGNKLKEIRNRSNISYWLAIVSANAALEYMRRNRASEPLKTSSLQDMLGNKELAELVPASGCDPRDLSARNETIQRIERAIESLPGKEKLVLKLNLLYGKKYEEITDILRMPYGTVANYIKRAKGRLREKLKDFK